MKNKITVDFALPLSQKEYSAVFKAYKNISTEWTAILEWIQNKLLTEIPKKDRYTILSVGSGAGDFDYQLIRRFKDKFDFIEYTAIEPNDACVSNSKYCLTHILLGILNIKFILHYLRILVAINLLT